MPRNGSNNSTVASRSGYRRRWLLGGAMGVLVLCPLAVGVFAGSTQSFDEWCIASLRTGDDLSRPVGPFWMMEVVRDVTALGGHAVLTFVTLAGIGGLWLKREYAAIGFVLFTVMGGRAWNILLKAVISRPRTTIVPHLTDVVSSSFPSGHAMMSTVVYFMLGIWLASLTRSKTLKVYAMGLALLLTGLVGASRVYLGVHYPTDVLSGWVFGILWVGACWLACRVVPSRFPSAAAPFPLGEAEQALAPFAGVLPK